MTGINHVLTGAAIGLALKQPLLVAPLAFLSHFVLDVIPHFDHELYRYGSRYFMRIMVTDGILSLSALTLVVTAAPEFASVIMLGALFGILPDLFWPYYYAKNRPPIWFFIMHSKMQWFERPAGIFVEISYLILITTIIFALL